VSTGSSLPGEAAWGRAAFGSKVTALAAAPATRESFLNQPRVITKYPNRRLYDTTESRYVTLADIRRLVLERIDFAVIDKKSGADITRGILLQVIAEQEHEGEPMMSEDFLAQVIRAYGGTMQGIVGNYLEQSLKLLMAQQQQIRDRMRSMVGIDPLGSVTALAEKNLSQWKKLQEQLLGGVDGERPTGAPDRKD
jgi:polyhydroxyalkanoate synthesis repressor PhaR